MTNADAQKPELKACPFCGCGTEQPRIDLDGNSIIECASCPATITGLTKHEVVRYWNDQPVIDRKDREIAELRAENEKLDALVSEWEDQYKTLQFELSTLRGGGEVLAEAWYVPSGENVPRNLSMVRLYRDSIPLALRELAIPVQIIKAPGGDGK